MRILLCLFCLSAIAVSGQRLDIRAQRQLTPVRIDSMLMVYSELQVSNISADTLTLVSVTVNGKTNAMVNYLNLFEEGLLKRSNHSLKLAPGDTSVIYIESRLGSVIPKNFTYRITVERALDPRINIEQHARTFVETVHSKLSGRSPVSVGLPLRGGPWCAIYDPAWQRGHRRVRYTVKGKTTIPGRFAIDFMRQNNNGLYAGGNEDSIHNWLGYAAEVLAVADGVIGSVKDSFPESPTVSGHVNPASDKATGNYISLRVGRNQYVFYEHLKPGSIRVRPGQRVRKGDVIAALGFTGQTTGPHLHLHVADKDSPLGAEGLPFVFDNFTQLGRYDQFEDFGKKPWTSTRVRQVKTERPAPKSILLFPD